MNEAADAIIPLYEKNAAGWDEDRRFRRPEGEQVWMRRFADIARPGSRLLDVGCGSGEPIVADLLAAGHKVTGIDASASLIAMCRERFPEQEWIAADMRGLDLGRRFGGLIAWHSLFHLPPDDQAGMFPIFARHLEKGAPLMFTSGPLRTEWIGSWRGEPLYHASLDRSEYERLLGENGFAVIDYVSGDPNCGNSTIWMARREN